MATAEIRKDGKKKYRLILHSQPEHRGGVHNTHLRGATYDQCGRRIEEWRKTGVCD
jgi:hypothetical protein